ncbi:MAG: maleylpyruvate isomerase N-terminal domain-containing protein [Haliscomenobacter sp.]|uniref:maleylpyruvate isomerase N-terminal domain-containing protein n=1 Tax=Haliscomenobacter sp. TaxID=2717303 RepID=UPI0029BA3C53|nr:maleylpyruvate isomerase N-terminal domain-containing protein [Haliscomenobacter sp.]MDX2067990.1 maleylpyruvate isomerase N-terminal domain-containing protein [Haliscomenobacter sp.]
MPPELPILTLHLFPKLDELLLDFLRNLSPADWEKQTIVPLWTIKDIAAHLLDGNLRTLSMSRDGYFGEKPNPIESYGDLVAYLNRLNADWVKAFKRVSPTVLIELLELTGSQYNTYLKTLNPYTPAIFSVAWAGEENSQNWFHIAREYTEKWHHQQQMRLAMGQEEVLYATELYFPYLDTSMQALPHHYRNVMAEPGTVILFEVKGIPNAQWYLQRGENAWVLSKTLDQTPIASVGIEGSIAWRMLTKGIAKAEAAKRVEIEGDQKLGAVVLDMLAVMA